MDLTVETLKEYNNEDATKLGLLLKHLSSRFNGNPIPQDLLEEIIRSPDSEQLVARLHNRIVGAATLSIIRGIGAGRIGYLEDFVTDTDVRGQGVGDAMWSAITTWCQERDVKLEFTSNQSRQDAHRFYKRHGAVERETTVFRYG